MEIKPLSLDEHTLIGLELCAMRERLRILAIRINTFYGKEIGNSGRLAADAVDRFRDVLSDQILQICPKPYESKISSVYHCTERLNALREEKDVQLIGERILGIAG